MVGVTDNNDTLSSEEHCPDRGSQEEEGDSSTDGEFDWSPSKQGLMTGSYYYGYTAGQVGNRNILRQRIRSYIG